MAKSQNVIHDVENHEWKILETGNNGDEKTRDTVPDVVPMGKVEALRVFQGLIKEETNARRAALSMLCHIFEFAKVAENKLDLKKFMGKGDLKTGQLGVGIKDDYKLAEDLYFKQWMDENHPEHKAYVAQLPKLNERSQVLEEENRHSYFVTRTRKTPSYANAKNLFLNFIAFCGVEPYDVDENGELSGIMPPEVMRAKIAEAKRQVPASDNSWEKKMQDLCRQLLNPDDSTKPLMVDYARIPGLMQDLKMVMDELSRRKKVHDAQEKKIAEIREKYHGGGVPALGDDAITAAQNSAKHGAMANAGVKEAEPAKP